MPNWCHDRLEVRGDPDLLAKFADKVKVDHQPLTFEAHVPLPSPEEDGEGWYEWRLENWGCKWDANFGGLIMAMGTETMDVQASKDAQGQNGSPEAGMLVYKFDTPWSPPVPWLTKTSELEPDLEFELWYGEVGNDAAGRMKVVAGVVIEDEELEIEDVLAPEEMWF